MKRAALFSGFTVVFIIGVAFGFYLWPIANMGRMHVLAFTQSGACSPALWEAPWAVILNDQITKVAPPNDSLPLSNTEFIASPNFKNYSVIGFYLPNGVYTYQVE